MKHHALFPIGWMPQTDTTDKQTDVFACSLDGV